MIKSIPETHGDLPAPPAFSAPGNIRILYAEDEPLLADLVEAMVRSQGWQITCVGDGERAVQEWEKGDFDLILMDLQMPFMDGMEATRAIRKKERKKTHIPILALTAIGEEKRTECLAAGIDAILSKPFKMVGLIEAIKRHLNGRNFGP